MTLRDAHRFKLSIYVLSIGILANALFSLLDLRLISDLLLVTSFLASLFLSVTSIWKSAFILPLVGSLVGFTSEFIGLKYGFPFGHYSYEGFGARIAGVPIPIVIAWGIYLYVCYLSAAPFFKGMERIIITALLMVLLDLAIDPVMVELGVWRWEEAGEWFGIPSSNFLGWFITSIVALLLYKMLARRHDLGENTMKLASIPYILSFLPILSISGASSRIPSLISLVMALVLFSILVLVKVDQKRPSYTLRSGQGHVRAPYQLLRIINKHV